MRLSSADPIEKHPTIQTMRQGHHPWLQHSNQSVQSGLSTPFPIKTRARFEVCTPTIRSQVVGTVKKMDKSKYLNLSSSHSVTLWATRWQSICSNRMISELSHWLISTGTNSTKEPTMTVANQSKGSWKPHLLPSTGVSQDTPYAVASAPLTQLNTSATPPRSKVPCGTATTLKPLLSSRNCSTARTSSGEKSLPMMIPRGGGLSVSSKVVSVSLLYEVMMAE